MHKNFCVAVPFVNKTVQNPILNIQFASQKIIGYSKKKQIEDL